MNKENGGNVLFNNELSIFYYQYIGIGRNIMVKNHINGETGNLLPLLHGLLFLIDSKWLYMHYPMDRIIHTTTFGVPVIEDWLEQKKPNERSAGVIEILHKQVTNTYNFTHLS